MVEQVGPGTMIGASVLLGETYMVTAQCVTDCKIMTIGKTPLEQIVNANPRTGLTIGSTWPSFITREASTSGTSWKP